MTANYLSLEELWNKKQIYQRDINHLDWSHLLKDITIPRQIVWHLMNNMTKIPKCQVEHCHKSVNWNRTKYLQYCSSSCAAKDPHKIDKTKQTMIERFGVSCNLQTSEVRNKVKQTNLERYGIENPFFTEEIQKRAQQGVRSEKAIKKRQETIFEKYGVQNISQCNKIKELKENNSMKNWGVGHPSQSEKLKEQKRQTNLEKYGVEYSLQIPEVREQIKQTNLERYGVTCIFQTPKVRNKIIEKYGVENPFQAKEIKEQIKQTNLERYGVEHGNQIHFSKLAKEILFNKEKFVEFMKDKTWKQAAEHLDVSKSTIYSYIEKYQIIDYIKPTRSYLEDEMAEFLSDQKIKFKQNDRTQIKPLELDFYLPDHQIAIEMNGDYWHSDNMLLEMHGMTADEYHQMKTDLCNEKGIELIHISESDWNNESDRRKFLHFL